MKISHRSKRSTAPHPQIIALITDVLATSTDDLPDYLAKIESWRWPRSDLNAWIKVLNKFDTILEDVIRDYNIDKLQLNAFTPRTKATLLEILKFERLLLENSTNRKMFNSYDRLNSLLSCSDLDVIIAALLLLLRPSQQYSSQPALSHSLHVSTARLQSLAKHWQNLREHGIDMLEFADPTEQHRIDCLSVEASEVHYTFYRKVDLKAETQPSETDPFEVTPGSSKTTKHEAGPVTISFPPLTGSTRDMMDILADAVETFSIPDDEKFELLCRLRAARALEKGREEDRRKLVTIRLLAIAVYVHTNPEASAQTSLFIYEPELVSHVAELLQLERALPYLIQASAIAALDALARYRNRIHEVLTTINASVNHGLLMTLLRKTVNDIASPTSTVPHLFVDALLSFVIFIASHTVGGNMVVGAGLLPLLIQIVDNKNPSRLPIASKTMQLIDNLICGYTNGFHIFCNSHGVESVVERIRAEVTLGVETHGNDETGLVATNAYGLLPFAHIGVLKHALRSMHRMMTSSGSTEGLRGLIDTSLLGSIKTIMQHRGLFGPAVLPIGIVTLTVLILPTGLLMQPSAINIMATFVHNEPTALATIQEAGLPEVFYKTVEQGIEPSIEVIQSIPNAIGALCLSQTGQDQFLTYPSIIPALVSILTSEPHLKVLRDKENATAIGNSIDELIRHHPWLKKQVFESLKSIIAKLEVLGSEYVPPSESERWYALTSTAKPSSDNDVRMEDAYTATADANITEAMAGELNIEDIIGTTEELTKPEVNTIVTFIDVLGRFLEGLFQHTPHCKDFINTAGGLDRLGALFSLPCLPYDFANSANSDSLVQVIRTMTEVCPVETLTHLMKQVKSSLAETKDYWEKINVDSRFLPMINIEDKDELAKANRDFRCLITLYIRLTFLSDVFSTAGYAHGRSSVSFLPILNGSSAGDIISELGALHRAFIWENIIFKTALVDKGLNITSSPTSTPEEGALAGDPLVGMVNGDAETLGLISDEAPSADTERPENAQTTNVAEGGAEEHNAKALKHIIGQVSNSLTPFFQAVGRMFMYGRRNADASQKKQAATTSAAMANVLYNHLALRPRSPGLMPYAFCTVMMGILIILTHDERSTSQVIHAMLMVDFRRVGGLSAILEICGEHTQAIERLSMTPESERSKDQNSELVVAYGGLRVALNLVHSFISSKPPGETGQNQLFLPKDKPETDPNYYEAHDFLVKLRLAMLPLLKDLWHAPWLVSAPPSVGRSVIQSILELAAGDNEEPRSDYGVEVTAGSGAGLLRPSGPDEDRIQQLVDMGFLRTAAVRALTRSGNNISVATEFLLSNPMPLPIQYDDVEDPDNGDEVPTDAQQPVEGASGEQHEQEPPLPANDTSEPIPNSEGTAEERRKELVAARELLIADLGRGALRLVDAHPALIFDARQAFTGRSKGHHLDAVRCIIEDIKNFAPSSCGEHENRMAVRFHILALILAESPSLVSQVLDKNEQELMDILLGLLPTNGFTDNGQAIIPKWLASHLLVSEFLLILSEEPRAVALPLAEEDMPQKELLIGPSYSTARSTLFRACIQLLALPSLPRDELLAMFKLLMQLTRDHSFALQFVNANGVTLLIGHLNDALDDGGSSVAQASIAIILRHLMEDNNTLQQLMEHDIKRLLAHPRTKNVDVSSYIRNCVQMASRDPETFVKVTVSLCKLVQPDTTVKHLQIRPTITTSDVVAPEEKLDMQALMHVDAPAKSESASIADAVIHFMVSELMRVGRSASESIALGAPNKSRSQDPGSGDMVAVPTDVRPDTMPTTDNIVLDAEKPQPQDKPMDQAEFLYACALMQYLTELLFSYDSCKHAFLSYSKKKTHTPGKEIGAKHKPIALQYLLTELISFGAFNVEPKFDGRKRIMLCNWAMSVVVALCVDCSAPDLKEASNDLTHIRKMVLEAINRAIKDASPSESMDARYGRLLALADLCHRLLTVRFNVGSSKPQDETPVQIAKLMLEKNFVTTLTNVLSEVDLNYPNMRSLVSSILRPLEHLTKIAIKMGRANEKAKETAEDVQNSTDGDASGDDDDDDMDEDDPQEETPDLYRNSALGMLGGEMEDGGFIAEDELDQDDELDEDDVDVDYDEETGSDDTSNTDEEDVEEAELEIGLEGDESGAAWQDEDEDMEDVDGGSDDEDEESQAEEAGLVDAEIMWQDVAGTMLQDGEMDGQDDDEDLEDMHIVQDDEAVDEAGNMSEEDDIADDLGALEDAERVIDDTFGFVRHPNRGFRTDNIFFGGRPISRSRGDGSDMFVFGRPRQSSSTAPESTMHPLLVDGSSSINVASSPNRNFVRRPQRTVVTTGDIGDVMSIGNLVGGGTMQFIQHIVGPDGVVPDIRIELPGSQDRAHLNRHGRSSVRAAVRLERDTRGGENRAEDRALTPMPTLQRWNDEARMSHGKFLQERLSKLSNHIIISLLPEAREEKKERDRLDKEKADKEAAEAAAKAEAATPVGDNAKPDTETSPEMPEELEVGMPSTSTDSQLQEDMIPEAQMQDVSTANEDSVMTDADQGVADNAQPPVQSAEDIEIALATLSVPAQESLASTSAISALTGVGPDHEQAAAGGQSSDLEPHVDRITVMVHGSPVDITATGIDPTFLEALPDDMREEVLNQHFREQGSSRVEAPIDSQISAEFLDALPPEIRAEILQQERVERARRERPQGDQAATGTGAGGPTAVEMDPASFIASLEPQLREVVLLDQDDVFIQTLPSHMIAEAGEYRDLSRHHHRFEVAAAVQPTPAVRKLAQQRDAIQLLDQSGVTTLVRLLFFPQLVKKTALHKVLVNLCENSKSRTDLFNLLLNILQDGTGDLSVVDKSFAQMSFRNTKSSTHITPKPSTKRRSTAELPHAPLVSTLPNEISAELVAQRCLDALTYIVATNELSSLFFLTEHELPAGLKRAASRKGKGKEKQTAQSYYPIVLLLNLLDRQTLLKTPSIMESVAGLLATVTRPLASLQEQQKKESSTNAESSAVSEPAAAVPASNEAAQGTTSNEVAPGPVANVGSPQRDTATSTMAVEALEEKILLANPPQIPHSALRLIVNMLTVGECSARTFHHTLVLIQHLFCIPDARDVIAQELKTRAEDFGQGLLSDLGNLTAAVQANTAEDELPSALVARFSPASSDQAKFLRVLKTIDYMYSSKSTGTLAVQQTSADQAAVQGIYESFRFPTLWQKLSDCLSAVEQKSNVEHIATILLPLIESLMVVCKHVQSKSSPSGTRLLRSPTSASSFDAMEDLFVSFTDTHRKVLNLMVRNNPSLMSGSFSLLIHNPRVLDFDNKRNYFTQQLRRRPHPREHYGTLQLNVRRAHVFEHSYQQLQRKTGDQIKYGKLSVRFYDEEGVDAGGVTREWFQILARQMFDPNYALFEPCAADKQTYQPNRASAVNNEHLSYFKFVGRVIGKAIYDGRLLDAHFARSLYRQMLGKPVDYKDVEWVDPEYYNSLCWILENDPTMLDLTFITEVDEFGRREIIPLKEGGATIQVTNENKKEYVQLSAQYRLYSSIKDQIESLLGGFYEIVPKDLISIFNEQEVELLISGTPDIDVDEWRAATEYNGYTSSDPVIVWWWRALKSFNRDERAKVLSFATGTSRVPLGGFVELQGVQGVQRFSIHRAYGDSDRLPQAHTCFNQIDLPQYTSYEMLRQQLLLAINEGGEGFGFA